MANRGQNLATRLFASVMDAQLAGAVQAVSVAGLLLGLLLVWLMRRNTTRLCGNTSWCREAVAEENWHSLDACPIPFAHTA